MKEVYRDILKKTNTFLMGHLVSYIVIRENAIKIETTEHKTPFIEKSNKIVAEAKSQNKNIEFQRVIEQTSLFCVIFLFEVHFSRDFSSYIFSPVFEIDK